jgi:hypothetical protein
MANLTETSTYDAGVYQLQSGDLIQGGATGLSNTPLKNLTNRTKYLKDAVDTLEAGGGLGSANLDSPTFTGNPTAPTPPVGDNDTSVATTAFVERARGGDVAAIATTGGTYTMLATDYGLPVIEVSGALTSNAVLQFPTTGSGSWIVRNITTGAFTVSVKTDATVVPIPQGEWREVASINGAAMKYVDQTTSGGSGFSGWSQKSSAYTVTSSGERLFCNTSVLPFTVTLPGGTVPDGFEVIVKGNFALKNLTISRNGKTIGGVAADLVMNTDNATVHLVHMQGNWWL